MIETLANLWDADHAVGSQRNVALFQRYGLAPREGDVCALLVRGRILQVRSTSCLRHPTPRLRMCCEPICQMLQSP